MTKQDQDRLAQIRAENLRWSAQVNTDTWEMTFMLRLLDEQNAELRKVKKEKYENRIN